MKRMIAFVLSAILAFSLFSVSAFADSSAGVDALLASDSNERDVAKEVFKEQSDKELTLVVVLSILDAYNRGLFTENQVRDALNALNSSSTKASTQSEYYFGQGTYIVGTDLQAGTYDIICETTSNDSYTDSMSNLGDIYSDEGLGDYFNALGGLMESMDVMSVELINSKGWTEKFLNLKAGESARIILEEGMKIDITDGNAKLTFIR